MAVKRINQIYFLVDTYDDIAELPKKMGNECFVIDESCEYQCDSEGIWHKLDPGSNGSPTGTCTVWEELE